MIMYIYFRTLSRLLFSSILVFLFANSVIAKHCMEEEPNVPTKIVSAKAIDKNNIQIQFENEKYSFDAKDVIVDGDLQVLNIKAKGKSVFLRTSDLGYNQNYFVEINGYGKFPVDIGVLLDQLSSQKPLGYAIEGNNTVFRLFAPRAHSVKLVLFDQHNDTEGQEYEMSASNDGVWQFTLEGTHWGRYYGYKISGPQAPFEKFQPQQVIADPYSKAVCSENTYLQEAKSIILKTDEYNWEGDSFVTIPWEDLIIYEMHVRDMTVHPSAHIKAKGTYHGLIEKGGEGGINHVLELGVNAVELLPTQEFGNIEIPFGVEINGVTNTWNPYARNHWGYMTSYFFAPEAYYASDGSMNPDEYNGIDGQQVSEFKDMVKAFHKEGIAVIMDVVYNHVSEYDWNPFKYVDKQYYFRLDAKMDFLGFSGCGNDFKTERPMARRMILDSIKYWMKEYHIDGFRFDLAAMIDWETVELITKEARKFNPDVILIAEPWGGGKYDLGGFSERGWGAWNDLFRNGIKGQNPINGLGFIFGEHWDTNNDQTIKSYVRGSTKEYGGPFVNKSHSINYLESHDDHTLGDFVRIGTGAVNPEEKITDLAANAKLSEEQMQLNKLAAVFLLTSQGAVMIGEGQEFARSKVIAETDVPDPKVGHIDHNSYNKDNETNWLNFEHKELNRELFEYYQGLIRLRRAHPAFRRTNSKEIEFLNTKTKFSTGYLLPKEPSGDSKSFIVLVNANPDKPAKFVLPKGNWWKLVDDKHAGADVFGNPLRGAIKLKPRSAFVLAN